MSNWHFFWCNIAAPDFTFRGIPFEEASRKFSATSKSVEVVDPIYGSKRTAFVHRLVEEGQSYELVHEEWTPGVYVAFANDVTLPLCAPRFRWDPQAKWVRVD